MPIVPTTQRQVGTAPLPGVRVASGAPAEAFAPLPDLGGVENVAGRIHAQAMQEADQIAVNSADVQAADLRSQLHSQVASTKGTNALGALTSARQAWQDGVAQIADGLQGDRQRQMFMARAGLHWVELQGAAERHAATELSAEDTRTTDGILQQADRDAIDVASDPAKLDAVLAKKRAAIADYGRRQGWSPETTAAKTAEELSRAHLGVIGHLVDGGADLAAKAYLDAHRGDMTADALGHAERLERASSIRGEAQRVADGITATPPASLSDALDRVPKDVDPDVREHAEERVRRFYADRAASERQTRAQLFGQASSILEQTGDFDKIPLSLRTQLTPAELSSLQHRDTQMAKLDAPSDDNTFFRLMNMAAISPETRKEFLKENILSYPNLSEVQRRRLLNKQTEISRQTETRARSDSIYAARHGETTSPAATAAPAPAATPAQAVTPPANPLAGVLTPAHDEPVKKPTAAMLRDVQTHGEGYADYLRAHGYDVPANAHLVPAAGDKKK